MWLTDPLPSSYPPSVAVHAVRALAPDREEDYLRRMRQALFLEARNIARPEVLVACAADIGLDAARCTETPTFAQLGDSQFYAPGASVLL